MRQAGRRREEGGRSQQSDWLTFTHSADVNLTQIPVQSLGYWWKRLFKKSIEVMHIPNFSSYLPHVIVFIFIFLRNNESFTSFTFDAYTYRTSEKFKL